MSGLAQHSPAQTPGPYDPSGFYDEALEADGSARPHYASLLAALEGADLDGLARAVDASLDARGATFRGDHGEHTFPVDPIPRIIDAAEWRLLEDGVRQRARALNAFAADVYGDQEIVAAGVVPQRVIEQGDHYEPDMRGVAGVTSYAPVIGLDIVRGASGELRVLEDNVRTPSGLTYMLAAREATDAALPVTAPSTRLDPAPSLHALGAALRAAAPGSLDDPIVVLLSDGPGNSAWWEHAELARDLSIPIVTPDKVRREDARLLADLDGEGTVEIDVVYRRTDEDHLRDEDGRPTWVSELLLAPCRAGSIAVVNAFGAGVADDKLVHAYVDTMVSFYLDEEPLLPSVHTYDLGDPRAREEALERIDELVVKPRGGLGGRGIVICAHATDQDVEKAARAIREHPEGLVAQETVWLSRHPTIRAGEIKPRHVDLRLYALTVGDTVEVVPGGLTRVALDEGALVVNSSQNGGGKDTWVLGS